MCHTSAPGIISQIPSTMPRPARSTGTRPIVSVSSAQCAVPIGVSTSFGFNPRSAVAS